MKKLLFYILLGLSVFSEYKIKDKDVYYDDILLKGVSASTFEIVTRDNNYGKDKKNVYYKGKKVNGANPLYFDYIVRGTIESLYFKDKKSVYYEGMKIEDSDFKSFKILGSGYASDRNNVYHEGKRIEKADRKTFKISICAYPIDEHNGCPYAEDKNYLYKNGEIVRVR